MSKFNAAVDKIIEETKIWDSIKKGANYITDPIKKGANYIAGSSFGQALKPSGYDEFKRKASYVAGNKSEVAGRALGHGIKAAIKTPFNILKNFGKEAGNGSKANKGPLIHTHKSTNTPKIKMVYVYLPFSKTPITLRYNMWNAYEDLEKNTLHEVLQDFDKNAKISSDPDEKRAYKYLEKVLGSLIDYLNLDQQRIDYKLTNLPKANPQTTTFETFVDKYFTQMFV